MDFLNKLYENNYFGIGLFAVMAFLVVTLLFVIFFGKKDEKENENVSKEIDNNDSETLFNEVTTPVAVEPPVVQASDILSPDAQTEVEENAPVEELKPVETVSISPMPVADFTPVDIEPVAPINYDEVYDEPVIREEPVEAPVISEEFERVEEPVVSSNFESFNEPKEAQPVRLEPVRYEVHEEEPVEMEPIRIEIPEPPKEPEPLIKEEREEIFTPVYEEPTIVEPIIKDTYYTPEETEDINTNLDFDALARSISKELDELERTASRNTREEVRVTPINDVVRDNYSNNNNSFSSVYVNEPVRNAMPNNIDMPTKIDLPLKKND